MCNKFHVFFAFTSLFLMVAFPVRSEFADATCRILVSLPQNKLAVFSQNNGEYQKEFDFVGTSFSISPNQDFIAVERINNDNSSKEVVFYDLSVGSPKEVAIAPYVSFIEGSIWAHDNHRILLQDAHGNNYLYMYDLNTKNLKLISESFDPGLKVYQAVWSRDDSFIAFVAQESPFPKTDYENVNALYVVDPLSQDYHPISSPIENVGWYYEKFYWIGESVLAFTSCHVDNGSCGINLATLEGEKLATFSGNYWILADDESQTLLVLDRSQLNSDGIGEAKLLLLDVNSERFDTLAQLSVDESTPIPLFSLSKDKQKISYVNNDGYTKVSNITDSSSRFIEHATDYDAGIWSPNSDQLLFQSGINLYIYNYQMNKSFLAIKFPEEDKPNVSTWLCPTGKS